MSEKIKWKKTPMGGWTRYEGSSENYGPYIIEKEDTRSYSIWWGHFDIGEAGSISSAKKVAQSHCDGLGTLDDIDRESKP